MRRVNVEEARLLLEQGYIYVDVRSEPEYAAGHPAGALNLPWSSGGKPNDDFLACMRKLFAEDAKLLLGCQSGQRSVAAGEALIAAGYRDVVEMRPGYGGRRNAFGQRIEPGWAASGAPVELVTEGGSYAELKAKVG
jgi:rhodanese-related sulfurtransferase